MSGATGILVIMHRSALPPRLVVLKVLIYHLVVNQNSRRFIRRSQGLHMTWHAALLSIIGGIAALIAAVCWFWSSRIEVPANQDTFIDALQRIGYWNNKAALAACVAALFQGASLIL
jgi:hypothetical protein